MFFFSTLESSDDKSREMMSVEIKQKKCVDKKAKKLDITTKRTMKAASSSTCKISEIIRNKLSAS